jgi:AraC-like DNA-binding protein
MAIMIRREGRHVSRQLSLVHHEIAWRRPSVPSDGQQRPNGILATRWTENTTATHEYSADQPISCHVVSVALRTTRGVIFSDSKQVHSGRLKVGMVQLSGPRQTARAIFQASCDFLHLYVPNDLISRYRATIDVTAGGSGQLDVCRPFLHDPVVKQLSDRLLEADTSGEASAVMFADALKLAILTRVLGRHANSARSADRAPVSPLPKWRLRRVMEYVEANLGRSISLQEMAQVAGLTRMHFAAQFKVATGESPHTYFLARRIERAQELMLTTDSLLLDVALDVGFQTQAHFSTVFKRMIGSTPLTWRQLQRERHDLNAVGRRLPERPTVPFPPSFIASRAGGTGAVAWTGQGSLGT